MQKKIVNLKRKERGGIEEIKDVEDTLAMIKQFLNVCDKVIFGRLKKEKLATSVSLDDSDIYFQYLYHVQETRLILHYVF